MKFFTTALNFSIDIAIHHPPHDIAICGRRPGGSPSRTCKGGLFLSGVANLSYSKETPEIRPWKKRGKQPRGRNKSPPLASLSPSQSQLCSFKLQVCAPPATVTLCLNQPATLYFATLAPDTPFQACFVALGIHIWKLLAICAWETWQVLGSSKLWIGKFEW